MASTTILSDNGASSGSAGYKITAGNDGVLILQTTTSGGTATNAVYSDTLQNTGFGVVPNTWQSTRKAIQVGDTSALAYGGNQTTVGNNFFINSSGTNSYIKASTYAHIYIQGSDGSHEWYTAPNTGTAGGSASFTRLMAVNTGYSLALQGANSQTGTGITFPATQSASSDANTLDDYEEGSFTPSYLGGTTNPTVVYDFRTAVYTKVGNLVTFAIRVGVSTTTGGSGTLRMSLPFTASVIQECSAVVGLTYGWTGSNIPLNALIETGTSSMVFYRSVNSANTVSVSDLTNNSRLWITGSYYTA